MRLDLTYVINDRPLIAYELLANRPVKYGVVY